MMDLIKSNRSSSILGLALEANRLEAAVLRRVNGVLQVQQSASVPLALSPFTGDPELVGREIRNHLDQAGIKERHCAVCVPLNWVLALQSKLPDLPDEDLASFLQIEAERSFPSAYETLQVSTSRSKSPGGERYALLMAVPQTQVALLDRILRAAQLKPASFSLGITALQSPAVDTAQPILAMVLGGHGIDLQVTCGGGIVALRSLDGAVESEGARRHIDASLVARELRITIGQLPPEFGGAIKTLRVFGRGDLARQFVDDVAPRLKSMGLNVELLERFTGVESAQPLPAEMALSPALALGAAYLKGGAGAPEFMPPRVSQWDQLVTKRFGSRKLATAGAVASGVVFLVALAFGIQQWQLSSSQSKWDSMKPLVAELESDEQLIHKYRPWFDQSYRSLRVLKKVTESFPEDGYVTAKTLEMRAPSSVTCSGTSRDNQSYLRLLDKLRAAKEVSALKTESVRGQSPMQFTFNFQWEGVSGGN